MHKNNASSSFLLCLPLPDLQSPPFSRTLSLLLEIYSVHTFLQSCIPHIYSCSTKIGTEIHSLYNLVFISHC